MPDVDLEGTPLRLVTTGVVALVVATERIGAMMGADMTLLVVVFFCRVGVSCSPALFLYCSKNPTADFLTGSLLVGALSCELLALLAGRGHCFHTYLENVAVARPLPFAAFDPLPVLERHICRSSSTADFYASQSDIR